MKKAAVFLDRDGTINEQMGYINHLSRFHLLPGVAQAIGLLNEHAIPVFVVTNQSGLARGYFPETLLDTLHGAMAERLKAEGARLDGVYVCPHHPEAKEERYRLNCPCRKPKPGLFLQAAADHDLDLSRSYVVGDRWSDIKAAAACGAKGVLVLTGYGRGDYEFVGPRQEIQPSHIADDLLAAVQWIIKQMSEGVALEGNAP